MNTWNDLSIKEKAAMMKVAVQNGITTLPEIREAYNKFAEGGPEDDKVYYPPQSVLDNIAENNGKYMITGTPPFATKYETAWPYIKSSSMLAGKLNQVMKSNMNKAGKYIAKKLPEKYRNLAEQGIDAVKRTLLGWGPGAEENYGSPVMSKFPAFIKSFEHQYEDKKAYGGLLS